MSCSLTDQRSTGSCSLPLSSMCTIWKMFSGNCWCVNQGYVKVYRLHGCTVHTHSDCGGNPKSLIFNIRIICKERRASIKKKSHSILLPGSKRLKAWQVIFNYLNLHKCNFYEKFGRKTSVKEIVFFKGLACTCHMYSSVVLSLQFMTVIQQVYR